MDPASLLAAYQAVQTCYKGGRFAHKVADKHVSAYAEREGISKQEAWSRVRAEAKRQGDERVTQAADLVIKAGPLGILIPGGTGHCWFLRHTRGGCTSAGSSRRTRDKPIDKPTVGRRSPSS